MIGAGGRTAIILTTAVEIVVFCEVIAIKVGVNGRRGGRSVGGIDLSSLKGNFSSNEQPPPPPPSRLYGKVFLRRTTLSFLAGSFSLFKSLQISICSVLRKKKSHRSFLITLANWVFLYSRAADGEVF